MHIRKEQQENPRLLFSTRSTLFIDTDNNAVWTRYQCIVWEEIRPAQAELVYSTMTLIHWNRLSEFRWRKTLRTRSNHLCYQVQLFPVSLAVLIETAEKQLWVMWMKKHPWLRRGTSDSWRGTREKSHKAPGYEALGRPATGLRGLFYDVAPQAADSKQLGGD